MPQRTELPPAPAPQLFRFGLKHLLLGFALVSVLATVVVRGSGHLPMVVIVGTVLVGAHVFATLIGNRLQETSRDFRRWGTTSSHAAEKPIVTPNTDDLEALDLPRYVPLAEKNYRSVWGLRATLAGVVAGTLGGLLVLLLWPGGRPTIPGVIVGCFSCGILGAWIGFLAGSFGPVTRHAWKHARQVDEKAPVTAD